MTKLNHRLRETEKKETMAHLIYFGKSLLSFNFHGMDQLLLGYQGKSFFSFHHKPLFHIPYPVFPIPSHAAIYYSYKFCLTLVGPSKVGTIGIAKGKDLFQNLYDVRKRFKKHFLFLWRRWHYVQDSFGFPLLCPLVVLHFFSVRM